MGTTTLSQSLQILLTADRCTSSFTNRGGINDNLGDGSWDQENRRVSGTLVRVYDKDQCNARCGAADKRKFVTIGNPEVKIPEGYSGLTTLSWFDLSELTSDLENINVDRTGDSSWLLKRALDSCMDANGNDIPDPAGLAYTDLMSTGRGK